MTMPAWKAFFGSSAKAKQCALSTNAQWLSRECSYFEAGIILTNIHRSLTFYLGGFRADQCSAAFPSMALVASVNCVIVAVIEGEGNQIAR